MTEKRKKKFANEVAKCGRVWHTIHTHYREENKVDLHEACALSEQYKAEEKKVEAMTDREKLNLALSVIRDIATSWEFSNSLRIDIIHDTLLHAISDYNFTNDEEETEMWEVPETALLMGLARVS
jgi:hypothetical protein